MDHEPWNDEPWNEDESTPASSIVLNKGTHAEVFEGTVEDSVALEVAEPLTMDEARDLTEHIRSTADVLYVLLARAHRGKAWEALGYGTFEAYVRSEFDISRSRAYQILDQARVVEAIEAAAPEGTDLRISEAAARDLKSVIGEVQDTVRERTYDVPANEAGEVVEEVIEEYRGNKQKEREQREAERQEQEADRAERAGFSSQGEGGTYTPPPAPSYGEEDVIDAAEIRRNVQAAYDLYSSLSALKSMPDIQSIIDTIPIERRVQIHDSLPAALAWLQAFQDQWAAQPWQTPEGEPDADGFLVGDHDREY